MATIRESREEVNEAFSEDIDMNFKLDPAEDNRVDAKDQANQLSKLTEIRVLYNRMSIESCLTTDENNAVEMAVLGKDNEIGLGRSSVTDASLGDKCTFLKLCGRVWDSLDWRERHRRTGML